MDLFEWRYVDNVKIYLYVLNITVFNKWFKKYISQHESWSRKDYFSQI